MYKLHVSPSLFRIAVKYTACLFKFSLHRRPFRLNRFFLQRIKISDLCIVIAHDQNKCAVGSFGNDRPSLADAVEDVDVYKRQDLF